MDLIPEHAQPEEWLRGENDGRSTERPYGITVKVTVTPENLS